MAACSPFFTDGRAVVPSEPAAVRPAFVRAVPGGKVTRGGDAASPGVVLVLG